MADNPTTRAANARDIHKIECIKETHEGLIANKSLCDLYDMETVVSLASPTASVLLEADENNLAEKLSFPNIVQSKLKKEPFADREAPDDINPLLLAPLPRKADLVLDCVISESQKWDCLSSRKGNEKGYSIRRLNHRLEKINQQLSENISNRANLLNAFIEPNQCLKISDLVSNKSRWKKPLAMTFNEDQRVPLFLVACCLCSPEVLVLLLQNNSHIKACSSTRRTGLHSISFFFGQLTEKEKDFNEARLVHNAFLLLLNGLNPFALDTAGESSYSLSQCNKFTSLTELFEQFKTQLLKWHFQRKLLKSVG